MITLLWLLLSSVGVMVMVYRRAPLWMASLFLGMLLLGWTFTMHPAHASITTVWSVFLIVALVFNVPVIRRVLLSRHLLKLMRAALPPMSQTEREALEAGTVWWEGELFRGNPDWNKLLAYPVPRLSAEEQEFLDGPVETLCRMIDDWHITEERRDLPPEVWKFIKDNGFFAMIIPKRYGGLEFSALAHSSVVMKIATRSITTAVTVMVPNSLGPAELLLHYGTDEQKNYYLPRLARGQEIPCFALTGPEAGSDASSIPDTGTVCRGQFQGREIVGIRLNWEKRYITLGPVATLLGLAFKLYDPEGLLGGKKAYGITCALIPTDTSGVVIGNRHFPLNIPFMNGPNSGKDVFIPLEWIIGGAERAGHGWRMLMECLAAGRSISLPALATGAGKLVCRASGAYGRVRKQFKTPIGRFEGVEEVLARMAGYTYLMDATRIMTASAIDLGEKPSVVSAIAKYQLTERMRIVVNDAMDVQGGNGICMGPRNWLARVYQSIPISITVEGANILTRTMIIFGQGAIRCHPYVLKEMQAATKGDVAAFDHALFGHVGYLLSNSLRAMWIGVTGARYADVPGHGDERRYYKHLTRLSIAFALSADVCMLTLGGTLKRREKLSGRLADVLSQMYLASCALKHYADHDRPAGDLPLLRYACEDALYRAEQALDGLLNNLPQRWVARILRRMVLPWGTRCAPPTDALGHAVASVLLAPGEVRERLTQGMFVSAMDTAEPLGRLERALIKADAAEPVEKKLRAMVKSGELNAEDEVMLAQAAVARGLISPEEAQTVFDAVRARLEVIKVDDFSSITRSGEEGVWPIPEQRAAVPSM